MKTRRYAAALLSVHLGEAHIQKLDLSCDPLPPSARAALTQLHGDCVD